MPNDKQRGLLSFLIRSTRLPRRTGWTIQRIEKAAERMPEDEFSYLIDDLKTYDRVYAESYLEAIKNRLGKYINRCDDCGESLSEIEAKVNAEQSKTDGDSENICSRCGYLKYK